MLYDVKKLKYVILPGKFPEDPLQQDLHNKAYLFWETFWNNVFKQNGTHDKVNPDNFWRQDMIAHLMYGDEIVGQFMHTIFNLKSSAALNHSYLVKGYNEKFIKTLLEKKTCSVMSMEHIAISDKWRKKNCGIALGAVFVGIACKHIKAMGIDALIAPSRSDIKVNEMVMDFGGIPIQVGLEMHNTPVDLMAIFKDKIIEHPDQAVRDLVNKLWGEHVTVERKIAAKKAA